MPSVRIAAIIPARMASTRFPGKPLLELEGLPMVEHVRRRVTRCQRFSEVVVATCDQAIADVVASYGGRVLMTDPGHAGASDRVAEAMGRLECTHVVNVQGDEILVLASDLDRMVQAMEAEPEIPAWNATTPIEREDELADRAIVKAAVSRSGRVLFCSREFPKDFAALTDRPGPLRKIIGILGYTRACLARYVTLPRTPLERAEGIDQSRLLEHDIVLREVLLDRGYPGINEPREVALVRRHLAEDPTQQAVLQEILQR